MIGTRRPTSYTRHEEVRHGRYWRVAKPGIRSGLLHRSGGPAIELANGEKQWWIDGKHITSEKGDSARKPKGRHNNHTKNIGKTHIRI